MNGECVRDRIDIVAERENEKFRIRVINYFGLDDEAHPWLRDELNRATEAADARTDNGPLVECSTVRLADVHRSKSSGFGMSVSQSAS